GSVRASLDRALLREALRSFQEQLLPLATAELAHRTGITGHLLSSIEIFTGFLPPNGPGGLHLTTLWDYALRRSWRSNERPDLSDGKPRPPLTETGSDAPLLRRPAAVVRNWRGVANRPDRQAGGGQGLHRRLAAAPRT